MKKWMGFVGILLCLLGHGTLAQEPIKIGEVFPYSASADEAKMWRQGWTLAVDEVNKAGGILGRPLAVVSRDDKGNPAETVRVLEDFKNREDINIFIGTLQSHTALAASDFAHRNHMLMFRGYAGTSKLTAEAGHSLYLQLQPPSSVWAGILADKAAQSGKKRWAFIAADYELSRTVIAEFQRNLQRQVPDVAFVETQWFPLGKLDAGPVTQAIAYAKPDAIFVVAFDSDYMKLVREGNKRRLFDGRLMMGPFAGFSGYIRPFGKEAPVGWISGKGYPVDRIEGDKHKAFVAAFHKRYGEDPALSSFYSYCVVKILAQAMEVTGGDDPDRVAAYVKKTSFDMPGGPIAFRADGTSNLGEWVGPTGFENGVPTIVNPEYIAPDKYLPSAAENMKLWRP